jgi:hypothetical protein
MAGPGRPPNERDTVQFLNGCPVYLGTLVSTGAAVNNLTTATPFLSAVTGVAPGTINWASTLAGKMLLLQSTAAGLLLPSGSNVVTMTVQTGAMPGVLVASAVAQIILMRQDFGWLQWMPSSGSGNLLVWELS